MHHWGDDFQYFGDVGQAAHYIGKFLKRWGRVSVLQTKEKYGTARVYCCLGWHQFHDITHPGYSYNRYPQWLWVLDCNVGSRLISVVNPLVVRFHCWLYRKAYQRALAKWPHIREEILEPADFYELLEGL